MCSYQYVLLLLQTFCSPCSRVIPNCIMKAKSERRRPFVGDQLEDCRDASGLFYILPFQKVRYLSRYVDFNMMNSEKRHKMS